MVTRALYSGFVDDSALLKDFLSSNAAHAELLQTRYHHLGCGNSDSGENSRFLMEEPFWGWFPPYCGLFWRDFGCSWRQGFDCFEWSDLYKPKKNLKEHHTICKCYIFARIQYHPQKLIPSTLFIFNVQISEACNKKWTKYLNPVNLWTQQPNPNIQKWSMNVSFYYGLLLL